MVSVLPKKRILMRHGKSQENQDTTTYTITLDHNIQSTALRAGEHLCCVMDSGGCSPDWRMQFYVSPYAHTRSMLDELRRCFLKKSFLMCTIFCRNVETSTLSVKDKEEKAKRCEFVQGLLLSTILDDNL
uniref:Di19 C-terminal domain-containing protein n=1 Tax=Glycine max TaxID=3847 RepID=A0A0R0EFK8_SOYBN